MADTLSRVTTIVRDHLDLAQDRDISAHDTVEDLGADSLDAVELCMACEEEFDIHITDPQVASIVTVADLVEVIERARATGDAA